MSQYVGGRKPNDVTCWNWKLALFGLYDVLLFLNFENKYKERREIRFPRHAPLRSTQQEVKGKEPSWKQNR